DRPVGYLDMIDTQIVQDRPICVQLSTHTDRFEQRPAEVDRNSGCAIDRELPLEWSCDDRRSPPELDDIDVIRRHLEEVLHLTRCQTLVEQHCPPDLARLRWAIG